MPLGCRNRFCEERWELCLGGVYAKVSKSVKSCTHWTVSSIRSRIPNGMIWNPIIKYYWTISVGSRSSFLQVEAIQVNTLECTEQGRKIWILQGGELVSCSVHSSFNGNSAHREARILEVHAVLNWHVGFPSPHFGLWTHSTRPFNRCITWMISKLRHRPLKLVCIFGTHYY